LVTIPAPQAVADPEFVKWFMEELAHENQADKLRQNPDQPTGHAPPKAGAKKKKNQ
jgi:hypothetical protein